MTEVGAVVTTTSLQEREGEFEKKMRISFMKSTAMAPEAIAILVSEH